MISGDAVNPLFEVCSADLYIFLAGRCATWSNFIVLCLMERAQDIYFHACRSGKHPWLVAKSGLNWLCFVFLSFL